MEVKVGGMDAFPEEQHRGHRLTSEGARSKGSADAWRMSCSAADATTWPYRRESVPLGPAAWPTVVRLLHSLLGTYVGDLVVGVDAHLPHRLLQLHVGAVVCMMLFLI